MTRLYVEIAVGAFAAIIFSILGWHFGSLSWKSKYEALVVSQAQASAEAAVNAAARIQQERKAYDDQLKTISDSYHRELATSDATADDLTRELHDYESRLSRCSLPSPASPADGAHDAREEPGRDQSIADEVGALIKAAGDDASQLSGLQLERLSLNHGDKK